MGEKASVARNKKGYKARDTMSISRERDSERSEESLLERRVLLLAQNGSDRFSEHRRLWRQQATALPPYHKGSCLKE